VHRICTRSWRPGHEYCLNGVGCGYPHYSLALMMLGMVETMCIPQVQCHLYYPDVLQCMMPLTYPWPCQ
jgi:hypothetical protein